MTDEAQTLYTFSAAWADLARVLMASHDLMARANVPIAHCVRALNAARAVLGVAQKLEAHASEIEASSPPPANDNAGGSS